LLPETGSQGPIFDHRQDGRQPPPDTPRDATRDQGTGHGAAAPASGEQRRRPDLASFSFACAAASRAIGTRGPEHDT